MSFSRGSLAGTRIHSRVASADNHIQHPDKMTKHPDSALSHPTKMKRSALDHVTTEARKQLFEGQKQASGTGGGAHQSKWEAPPKELWITND